MTRCPECFNHTSFCTCNKTEEEIRPPQIINTQLYTGFYL